MTLNYHVTGWISVFFFTLCLFGIASQLREIQRRKAIFQLELENRGDDQPRDGSTHQLDIEFQRPTAILSLNQFFASFLAFYAFLVLGVCSTPLNHYLIWTRLVATFLVMTILYEIRHDRRDALSTAAFSGSVLLMIAASALPMLGDNLAVEGRWLSSSLALFAAGVFAQGLIHQIIQVRAFGRTGAVSLRMHQLTTCKDASTIAFGLAMSLDTGWPLLVVGLVGVSTKSVLMWHFRWVRNSPLAAERRAQMAA